MISFMCVALSGGNLETNKDYMTISPSFQFTVFSTIQCKCSGF